jgi:hypothetical protein
MRWFYVPGIAAGPLSCFAFFAKWPKWIFVPLGFAAMLGAILGARHTKWPFCNKGALDDDYQGFDPNVCPHCSMRLK